MADAVKVARSAAVCEEADILGAVSVGEYCGVHPRASLRALAGPIALGARCFVEDRALLENTAATPMTVGSGNVFESGCTVRSARIGDGNLFEPKAEVRAGSVVGNNCLIGSGVVVAEGEHVPDNTILVAVCGAHGEMQRVVRPQKDYLTKAHTALIQKYVDCFTLGAKSAYALEKHHRLLQS